MKCENFTIFELGCPAMLKNVEQTRQQKTDFRF